HREPHLVASGGPVDPLKHQLKREAQLQFADHDHGWLAPANRHEVATIDLALDLESEPLEEPLHGQVEHCLQSESPARRHAKPLRAVRTIVSNIYGFRMLSGESECECGTSAMRPATRPGSDSRPRKRPPPNRLRCIMRSRSISAARWKRRSEAINRSPRPSSSRRSV